MLLTVEGGVPRERTALGDPTDPAGWLDVADLTVTPVETLGLPPTPVQLVIEPRSNAPAALLAEEGDAVELDAGRAAFIEAQRQAIATQELGVKPAGWVERLLRRLLHGRQGATSGARDPLALPAPEGGGGDAPGPAPRAPRNRRGLLWKMRGGLERWLQRRVVGRALGNRHADYLRRMLDMFEGGDLNEALRHAIPLAKDSDEAGAGTMPWRTPAARDDLRLTAPTAGSGASLGLAGDLFELLRERYRLALHRLKAQGRFKEAAFVLSELLSEHGEAVELLEEHGLYAEAAALAETKGLDPELIVRLLFLAGERERAVAVARRHEAFVGAVEWLERRDLVSEAAALRTLWADSLASRGRYAAAVDAIWPVEPARTLALRWLELGIEQGGVAQARLLPKMAQLMPEQRLRCAELVHAIAADASETGFHQRRVLAAALDAGRPEALFMVRPLLRGLLRDQARGGAASQVGQLLTRRRQGVADIETDLRNLDLRGARPSWRPAPALEMRLGWFRGSGATPIFDAARLPDGRLLVALGEAGIRYLTSDGRTIASFEQPAHALCVGDTGDRAIAVARRGDASSGFVRLTRVDLAKRQASRWVDTRITRWAETYDGSKLFVTSEDSVLALDVTADQPAALWRVDRLGGEVGALNRRPDALLFVVQREAELTFWSYDLPSLRLGERRAWRDSDLVDPRGPGFGVSGGSLRSAPSRDGVIVHSGSRTIATIHAQQAARVRLGADGWFTVFDAFGRLLVGDVERGEWVTDLRL